MAAKTMVLTLLCVGPDPLPIAIPLSLSPPSRLFQHADGHVVNCIEQHPFQALWLAVSGIDSDVKLYAPTSPDLHPPGRRADEIMAGNRRGQGSRASGKKGGTAAWQCNGL